MKTSLILAVAVASAFHGAGMANDKLVQEKQCMGCHAIAEDGAGPSFQKIARLWKGRKDAEPMIVATIRQGSASSGGPHWNKATMPDQAERPLVSDAEARSIAKWILTQ
jgi:cytochrome c